jgi:hypothetical protein
MSAKGFSGNRLEESLAGMMTVKFKAASASAADGLGLNVRTLLGSRRALAARA